MDLVLHFPGKPPTHNSRRYAHWTKSRQDVLIYRQEAALKAARKPKFGRPVLVTAEPYSRDNRLADAGACFDVVKAVVDGVVDAGLLPDDGPRYVRRYELRAPVNIGEDLLVVTISEVEG